MKNLPQCLPRPSANHAVMEALIRIADGREACNPSLFELSLATGFSRRSVCRAILDLTHRGELVFSHRFAPDGSQLSNEYFLIEDERADRK